MWAGRFGGLDLADAQHQERFVGHLTANQGRLYAYILSLLPDANAAHDVLQQSNMVLWRKVNDWPEDVPFMAWACRVAYYEVLSHRRDSRRDRLTFDDELVARLADESPEVDGAENDPRQLALRSCMSKLPESQRSLLHDRYGSSKSVGDIAERSGRSVGAVSQMLYRIRQELLSCIRQHTGGAGA